MNQAEQLTNATNPNTTNARRNSFTDADHDKFASAPPSMSQTPPPHRRLREIAVDRRIIDGNRYGF